MTRHWSLHKVFISYSIIELSCLGDSFFNNRKDHDLIFADKYLKISSRNGCTGMSTIIAFAIPPS